MAPPATKGKDGQTVKTKSKPVIGRFDPYVGSISVTGLDRTNFEEYIAEKDAALVMFYDATEPQCDWSKKHFIRAAKTTIRENHGYAAVDCVKETELCEEEEATISPFPIFRLYSRGKLFDTYRDNRAFLHTKMKTFMERSPILESIGRPKRPCDL